MREAACEMGKLTKREEGEDLHDSQEKSKEMQIKHDLPQYCQARLDSTYFDLEKTIKS